MNNFASFTLGQISTPVNILKEFLEIFNRRHKCKAAILSWLDGKHFYGQEWVRITFEELADILGYCRETISKHLSELVADEFIEKLPANRFPKDTANKYRLNVSWLVQTFDEDILCFASKLLGLRECLYLLPKLLFSRCEKIDISVPNNSPACANNPATLETNLEFFKNNNTDVAEKKMGGDEELELDSPETENLEQNQATPFVVEPEQIDSSDEIDPDEDLSSLRVREFAIDGNRQDCHSLTAPEIEVVSTSNKPTKAQINETCTELKRLRINPEPCLGVIKKYWGNVSGAIARVKEAIAEGWCDNPTGLFINSCKTGAKGKNAMPSDVTNWLDWAYKKRLIIGFHQGFVYTPGGGSDGNAIQLEEMMRLHPIGES